MRSSSTPQRRSARRHGPLVAILVAATTLASCLVPPERERIDLGGDVFGAFAEGTRVGIEVPTCNGEPEVTLLEVTANEVRVEVTSERQRGDRDDCLDGVTIELDEPLGDRPLVDVTSGRTLRVEQR